MKEDYDMVIVSRYLDGAKSEDDDVITAFGNWLFTKTVNFLRGGHYTFASCSFGVSAGKPLVIAAPLSRIPSA